LRLIVIGRGNLRVVMLLVGGKGVRRKVSTRARWETMSEKGR
jgi:hypothetical protein